MHVQVCVSICCQNVRVSLLPGALCSGLGVTTSLADPGRGGKRLCHLLTPGLTPAPTRSLELVVEGEIKQESGGRGFPAPFLLIGLGCSPGTTEEELGPDKSLWAHLAQQANSSRKRKKRKVCEPFPIADLNIGVGACRLNSAWECSHLQGRQDWGGGKAFQDLVTLLLSPLSNLLPVFLLLLLLKLRQRELCPRPRCTELGWKVQVLFPTNRLTGQMGFGLQLQSQHLEELKPSIWFVINNS